MSAVLEKQIQQLEKIVQEQQKQIEKLTQAVFKEKILTTQTVYHTIQSLLNAKQSPTLALIASAIKADKMYVVEVLARNSQHIRYSSKNTIEELIAVKNTKDKLFNEGKLFYLDFIDYGQKKIIRLNNEDVFNQYKTRYQSHSYNEHISEWIIEASNENIEKLISHGMTNGSDPSVNWEKHDLFLWDENIL